MQSNKNTVLNQQEKRHQFFLNINIMTIQQHKTIGNTPHVKINRLFGTQRVMLVK
jgi:hypothetical protein